MGDRWEYKYDTLDFPKRKDDDRSSYTIEAEWLNAHGADGWRLKEKFYGHNYVKALFERKL